MDGHGNVNVSWMSTPMVLPTYLIALLLARFFLGHIGFPLANGDRDAHVAWTATHVLHGMLTFVAFHVARGSPVAEDQPLLANVSIWDQIDGGKLWTPARRVLITVPALLFLITCEVTGYNLPHLVINVGVLVLLELSPKLPIVRRYVGGVLGLRPPKA